MAAASPSGSEHRSSFGLDQNFFALFGLPERFAVDAAALDEAYRAVQSLVHPDRHATAGDAQKRAASQAAAHANEAYRTLRKPLTRAVYLCRLRGADPQSETDTAMPGAFLMQQMEWRETLAESQDAAALQALAKEVDAARRAGVDEVQRLLDGQAADPQAASQAVRKLMFIEKFAAELDDALDRLHA
ncbi:MAG: Fe-S protein assembly co-chaperone HscB [Candidatus Protistobacter heckmanni]|nr:Fe-S protein assembly co-chaperone HscB [Candidatus Protistobacter heckmanni]